MKNTLLILIFALITSVSFGQNKWHDGKIKQFVDAAAKEYNLDNNQVKELQEVRKNYVYSYIETAKNEKEGEISNEVKQEKNKELNDSFHNFLIKLTGKNYKELQPFLARMREELKN